MGSGSPRRLLTSPALLASSRNGDTFAYIPGAYTVEDVFCCLQVRRPINFIALVHEQRTTTRVSIEIRLLWGPAGFRVDLFFTR